MSDIHIQDFLRGGKTQEQVAQIMGVSQSAVHQAVKAGRQIYFRVTQDGGFEHYEIKRPRGKKAA